MNVRIFLAAILLGIACATSGCALIAAGVIGASVERQHRDWCRFHTQESNCWNYYR
jgi:TRAP-type mannitol/chloroaromatic compound transport system permease large subunit